MATVVHRALDGSHVSFSVDADLGAPLTAFGFAFPRGWRVSHAFNLYPGSRCDELLGLMDVSYPEIEYRIHDEIPLKDGRLRLAHVRRPVATGGTREYTFAAWEDDHASLSTAIYGKVKEARALFEALEFSPSGGSIAVHSPIDQSIRPLRCLKEIPGHGLLEISPRVPTVDATLPLTAGAPVAGGELYERTARAPVYVLVTETAAVTISAFATGQDPRALAESLYVRWSDQTARAVA